MKTILAALLVIAAPVMAQTTQYEQDTQKLFQVIYWPILQAVTPCLKAKYPDPVKLADCETRHKAFGIRFVTEAEGRREARECARLHAGLLARNKIYRIIDDAATDPWTAWRCITCTGTNQEDVAKRSVRSYVVDNNGNIYDHRMRYFLAPYYANKLGMVAPRFAATLWSQRKGQLGDILSQHK
jgi:hypothetical protein